MTSMASKKTVFVPRSTDPHQSVDLETGAENQRHFQQQQPLMCQVMKIKTIYEGTCVDPNLK